MGIDKDFLLWIMENPGNKYVMFRIAEFDKFEGIISRFVCRKDNELWNRRDFSLTHTLKFKLKVKNYLERISSTK